MRRFTVILGILIGMAGTQTGFAAQTDVKTVCESTDEAYRITHDFSFATGTLTVSIYRESTLLYKRTVQAEFIYSRDSESYRFTADRTSIVIANQDWTDLNSIAVAADRHLGQQSLELLRKNLYSCKVLSGP